MSAPPISRRRSVQRERLLTVLASWRKYRLLRVVAAAGFGKSTLGAQWFQHLADLPPPERPARAWVALDRTDDAPEVMLRHLVEALSDEFPSVTDIFTRGLATEQPLTRVLTDLLAQLRAHSTRIVLLFDDVHRIHSADTLALLQMILDDGPPNLHLALFSRTRPSLQIGRLQIEQAVLNLNSRNLSFDHDEFAAFVADSPLAALDDEKIARVERRAAGWAAGLQILVHATQPDAGVSLDEISEIDPAVTEDFWEYIEHEVLQNLPKREFDFLLDISLLPFLTSELCATVTGLSSTECEHLLRRITAINALVTMPDGSDAGRAGRIHAVLRSFLLRRLMQNRKLDELQAMRRRAAQMLSERGDVDTALDLLLPAPDDDAHGEPSLNWLGDDLDDAAAIVERANRTALQRGELVAVRRWISKFSEAVILTHPRLAVDGAWSSVHLLEPESERHLQRIQVALHAAPEQADDSALRFEVVAMEAMRRMIDGRYAAAWDALQRARTMPIPQDSLAAGYLNICSGYMMYGSRRTLDERVSDLHEAGDIFTRIGFLRGKIEALCIEPTLYRIYAEGAGLVASALRARKFMDEIGFDPGAYRHNLNREVGDALYSMNQLDAARAELTALKEHIHHQAPSTETLYTADVRLHLCDLADNTPLSIDDETDEHAWDVMRRSSIGLIVYNTAHRRIQRDMLRGRPDLCWRTVTSLGILPPDLTPETPLPHTIAVLSGAVFASRHLDTLGTQLIDFRTRMDALSHRFFKLHAHALLVQLCIVQRNKKAALVELRRLLADLEPGGFTRIVLDLPSLHPLLHEIDTPFAARLAALTNVALPVAAAISPAEKRILEQFSSGGSAAQIAERLSLSSETVRSHIKSIYAKLAVHDRVQALEQAREMGIL